MTDKIYLLWCAHAHTDFRLPEIESLVTMFKLQLKWIEKGNQPFCIVSVPQESDIRKLMSRTMLIRAAFELWADAASYSELHEQLRCVPASQLALYTPPHQSFRIQVETFCKNISTAEKIERIEELSYLDFEGPVRLNNPDHSFHLIEYYGLDQNKVPDTPYRVFFGRWICDGQRQIIHKLSLKKRKFIGNTSMDAELSLIMANQANVRPNSLVLDPFVGSGSLLVAAAYFGGYVCGTDINYLTLHGKSKPSRCNEKRRAADECVAANLAQYGLGSQYLDVIVADSALPLWKHQPLFDAIITDPPYGIREATERIGSLKMNVIKEEYLQNHIPSRKEYNLQELCTDLLRYSAVQLVLGGRLVYWLPVYNSDFVDSNVPAHACFKLISICKQDLTAHSSRCLITMVKIREPEGFENEETVVDTRTAMFRHKYFQAVDRSSKAHGKAGHSYVSPTYPTT